MERGQSRHGALPEGLSLTSGMTGTWGLSYLGGSTWGSRKGKGKTPVWSNIQNGVQFFITRINVEEIM